QRNWNIPAGARDAEHLIVRIRVTLAQDGRVLDAKLLEDSSLSSNPFYRAAADSARRAVYVSSPLKVPPTKYERWKEVTLNFDPKEMMGR
ncbi:MAG: cell envelope integrity protein TolA, partial [Alphaproteobacteria bacterium]